MARTNVVDLFPETLTPWMAAFQDINRRLGLDPKQVEVLGDVYYVDPWPCVEHLTLVADCMGISFDTTFEWFSARRAQAIGLQPGQYVTKFPRDCPRDYTSWRMVAAEFGEAGECRAREIHAAQYETTLLAAHPNSDESIRVFMPEVENPSERGDRKLPYKFAHVTCDQLSKFQTRSVTGDQPLEHEPSDLRPPRYIIPVDPPQYPNNRSMVARSSSKCRSDSQIIDMGTYRMQGDIILVD